MVVPNESLSDNPLSKITNYYLAKARAQVEAPGFVYTFDAHQMQRRAEKVTNLLNLARQKDGTPELLAVDDHPQVGWEEVIDALLKAGYAVVGAANTEPGKTSRTRVTPTPLVRSMDALDALRRRLNSAINGNDPRSDRARELRLAIFDGRTVTRARADYETEYELVVAVIRELEKRNRAPNGVRRMLPLIESALTTLKELPPTTPGRQPATPKPVPVDVQISTLALHLALGDLLSHAASTATDARLNSLNKVVNARRTGEVATLDAGQQDADEELGIEEPVAPAPVEETALAVVVSPGPVASGTAGTSVNGVEEAAVAVVVEEAVRERQDEHGRHRA